MINRRAQGEDLIKLLVVAIIAVVAIALTKSYFQKTGEATQTTIEEISAWVSLLPFLFRHPENEEKGNLG